MSPAMSRFSLLCALAALTAACSGPRASVPPIEGSEWKLLRIDGTEAAIPERARLTFHKGRIGANVGCNGIGGPYRIEGTQLLAGPLAQTGMSCEGPVWNQEKALGALLVGAPQMSLDGNRMTLVSNGHDAQFERIGNAELTE